jgi:hypothetical protein
MAKWKLVNSENVEPVVCDDVYSFKMLTWDEMAEHQVINSCLEAGYGNII